MKNSNIQWIGEIPDDWEVVKLIYSLRTPICDGPHETPNLIEEGIPFISVDSLNNSKCVDFSVVKKYISEKDYNIYSRKAKIETNDILFSKAATIGKTAIVGNETFMVWSPIAIIKNNPNIINNTFLYYLLNCNQLITAIKLSGSFNTQANVGMREMECAKIPLPPLPTQTAIATYLDSKCSEIDGLIADINKQIETLNELKKSTITEAVTKGLNKNAKLKDSGIQWIGMIPDNWEVIKIGRLFSLRNERNFKPMNEVQLLSLYTGIGVFPHGEQEERGNKAVSVEGYKIVHKNDIVVNIILAWMGAIGVSNYDGVTSPAYDVYIPNLNLVIPHFYHYVFRTQGIADECYRYGRGIMKMRWRTYSQEFKQISVPYPSPTEQQSIATYLDAKCSEFDSIISDKQKQISTLEAYKKSLIYEYVTGKKQLDI